jgi:hypothetical protein
MRTAETILGIIQNRGSRGLPLEDMYRQLYNPTLYLLAYGKIYRNKGAMTPGVTEETADGMSLTKVQRIIEALRQERFQWMPARRSYIEKKDSTKKRPLGLPVWTDKVLQEIIRLMLEAYYEPQFSDHSHGFRPQRGSYTSYNVAKNVVEFSTSIPREQLRPSYGAGFLGAPLTMVKPDDIPKERERGGRHGTSRTEHDQDAGGQRLV